MNSSDPHPTPQAKKKKKNTSDPMATKARNFESTSRFSSSAICKRKKTKKKTSSHDASILMIHVCKKL